MDQSDRFEEESQALGKSLRWKGREIHVSKEPVGISCNIDTAIRYGANLAEPIGRDHGNKCAYLVNVLGCAKSSDCYGGRGKHCESPPFEGTGYQTRSVEFVAGFVLQLAKDHGHGHGHFEKVSLAEALCSRFVILSRRLFDGHGVPLLS
jgi:hypothetical protein